jgi:response regulator RpfG family c-di-GMP phosphodiesterase
VGARLLSLADAYLSQATTALGPDPTAPDHPLARLRQAAGSRFDPKLVETLGAVVKKNGARLLSTVEFGKLPTTPSPL